MFYDLKLKILIRFLFKFYYRMCFFRVTKKNPQIILSEDEWNTIFVLETCDSKVEIHHLLRHNFSYNRIKV